MEIVYAVFLKIISGELEALEYFENPIITRSGELRQIAWHNVLLFNEQGRIVGTLSSGQDITEQKQMENALKDSEERLRSLYANATIGLYRTTPDGRILLANPTLVRMLGYESFEKLVSRTLNDSSSFEPSYPRQSFIDSIEKNGEIKNLEAAWMRRDGTILYLRESARAIRDSSGKSIFYDGTVEDITERKLAEAENKRLLQAIEQAGEIVMLTNVNGSIQYVNPAFEQTTGYAKNEVIGKTPNILKSGKQDEPFYRAMWETIAGGKTRRGRMINMRKDGSLYTEGATISPRSRYKRKHSRLRRC